MYYSNQTSQICIFVFAPAPEATHPPPTTAHCFQSATQFSPGIAAHCSHSEFIVPLGVGKGRGVCSAWCIPTLNKHEYSSITHSPCQITGLIQRRFISFIEEETLSVLDMFFDSYRLVSLSTHPDLSQYLQLPPSLLKYVRETFLRACELKYYNAGDTDLKTVRQ